jgi:hypothetical protein
VAEANLIPECSKAHHPYTSDQRLAELGKLAKEKGAVLYVSGPSVSSSTPSLPGPPPGNLGHIGQGFDYPEDVKREFTRASTLPAAPGQSQLHGEKFYRPSKPDDAASQPRWQRWPGS